jgi:quercetin dioxygenase-like cupin family protein
VDLDMSRYFPRRDQCGHHVIFGNVPITTYAGDHMQISVVDLPADGLVDWHAHANEQMGIVVSGRALFHIGEEVKELQAGDVYWIPGNVRHKVIPTDGPVRAVDVFYPIRDEYR